MPKKRPKRSFSVYFLKFMRMLDFESALERPVVIALMLVVGLAKHWKRRQRH
jgi:hypothetical protein